MPARKKMHSLPERIHISVFEALVQPSTRAICRRPYARARGFQTLNHIWRDFSLPTTALKTPSRATQLYLLGIARRYACLSSYHLTVLFILNRWQITEYYSVYVRYASEVDWRLNEDILHRKDNFHGARRHDCIILQGPDGLLFARLLMVFTCVALGTVHPMALITVYDPVTRVNWKDRALGFRRVREPPTTRRSEFIFLSSVIRGAYLVSTHEREGEFYVNDLIDADMFLRLLRHH